MASNFGKTIQVSTFGASHGYAIGGIVEGLPCGHTIDIDGMSTRKTFNNTADSVSMRGAKGRYLYSFTEIRCHEHHLLISSSPQRSLDRIL